MTANCAPRETSAMSPKWHLVSQLVDLPRLGRLSPRRVVPLAIGDSHHHRTGAILISTNANTRAADYRNALRSFAWTHAKGLSLTAIKSYHFPEEIREL